MSVCVRVCVSECECTRVPASSPVLADASASQNLPVQPSGQRQREQSFGSWYPLLSQGRGSALPRHESAQYAALIILAL